MGTTASKYMQVAEGFYDQQSRGSRYPILEVSGAKSSKLKVLVLGASNAGYINKSEYIMMPRCLHPQGSSCGVSVCVPCVTSLAPGAFFKCSRHFSAQNGTDSFEEDAFAYNPSLRPCRPWGSLCHQRCLGMQLLLVSKYTHRDELQSILWTAVPY